MILSSHSGWHLVVKRVEFWLVFGKTFNWKSTKSWWKQRTYHCGRIVPNPRLIFNKDMQPLYTPILWSYLKKSCLSSLKFFLITNENFIINKCHAKTIIPLYFLSIGSIRVYCIISRQGQFLKLIGCITIAYTNQCD